VQSVQIFVAVLGASNYYTYAEASFSQGLPDWTRRTAGAR
jgi:transposase